MEGKAEKKAEIVLNTYTIRYIERKSERDIDKEKE